MCIAIAKITQQQFETYDWRGSFIKDSCSRNTGISDRIISLMHLNTKVIFITVDL